MPVVFATSLVTTLLGLSAQFCGPLKSFIPTTLGTQLDYNIECKFPLGMTTQEITKVVSTADGTMGTITMIRPVPIPIVETVFLANSQGIYMVERHGHELNPMSLIFRNGDKPGGAWVSDFTSNGVASHTVHTTVGDEIVEVPAGTFRAVRVDSVITDGNQQPRKMTTWYARGIGLVKNKNHKNGVVKLLFGFRPGK